MIIKNGKEYRNLEEQVRQNKEDIANHYNMDRVLADFGIRVIGQINTAAELPAEDTFTGDYGDAYAVGETAPYSFYIWTRADVDGGHPSDYWFNIGELAIVGPAGPIGETGPRGEKGERGSKWFSGTGVPTTTSGYLVGDYYINIETGNIWHLHSQANSLIWLMEGNIKGPQGETGATGPAGPAGIPGPVGPRGPAGASAPYITILGVVASIDQLPTPSTVSRNGAYLVGATDPYTLYIIVGTNNLTWMNAGPFSVGTMVSANGEYTATFDADTKLSIPATFIFDQYGDYALPVARIYSGGRVEVVWRAGAVESDNGFSPTDPSQSYLFAKGRPVFRANDEGDVLLGNQERRQPSFHAAVTRLYVENRFNPIINRHVINGKLELGIPVEKLSGPVNDFIGLTEAIPEAIDDEAVTLFFNATELNSQGTVDIYNLFELYDNHGTLLNPDSSCYVQVGEYAYPITGLGYVDYGTGEYFRVSYIASRTPITLFYNFYNVDDDGSSFEELAMGQLDTNYIMYTV